VRTLPRANAPTPLQAAAQRAALAPTTPGEPPYRTVLLRPYDVAWTVNWLSETDTNSSDHSILQSTPPHTATTRRSPRPSRRARRSNLAPNARLVTSGRSSARAMAAFGLPRRCVQDTGANLLSAALARARLFHRPAVSSQRTRFQPTPIASPSSAHPRCCWPRADPLDPTANLRGWRRLFPQGRLVVVPQRATARSSTRASRSSLRASSASGPRHGSTQAVSAGSHGLRS
jgi:hypothetical protein